MAQKSPLIHVGPGSRVLLLPRVSTQRQLEEGTSLESQEDRMREYCKVQQYAIVACIPDAFTGTTLHRPALNEARKMIRDHKIDIIIIYAYDRFFRNQTHQTIFLYECRQQGVAVESITEKLDDSPTGRMTATMLGMLAELEHEKILERTQRGIRTRIEEGKIKPGPCPIYGYRWVDGSKGSRETHDFYEVDEEAAAIVRFIFDEVCRLTSLSAIARKLNQQLIPLPSRYLLSKGYSVNTPVLSTAWKVISVRSIVSNPAYIGKYRAFKRTREEVYEQNAITGHGKTRSKLLRREAEDTVLLPQKSCPPIIEESVWITAQEVLRHNRETSRRSVLHPELATLRGHVYCGYCGKPMHASYRKDRRTHDMPVYRYTCPRVPNDADGSRCQGGSHHTKAIDRDIWNDVV